VRIRMTVVATTIAAILATEACSAQGSGIVCGQLLAWMPAEALLESGGDGRTEDRLTTEGRLWHVATRIELVCELTGRYPERVDGVNEILRANGARCQLDRGMLFDAWGTPVFYGTVDGVPVLRSAGPDRTFSTADDVPTPSSGDALARVIDARSECGP